ncbi:hypothetical protein CLV28_0642 [Sediminihabitans luteus]|uniref:Glycosyl hydrolase family 43 n=1 Tax=Sediminihabitans luteus TaxID=1138585 RepID=A0A2M9CZZ9_9CELL|nr:glycosyl hydrolase [Sediminihabitans luteus]PJJ77423.1 hypothetical protein CLV28_0642 [Sediminihabitans luteus]GII98316.1 glycosyl hydrolase [Sediminihabitans luteus]
MSATAAASSGTPAPLFRDPVHDAATDPVLVWHRERREWWMFYTQRRAASPGPGVAWVHGSDVGVATSSDGGQTWTYRGALGAADGFRPAGERWRRDTFWAPEVLWAHGEYHMYLTTIEGVPDRWEGHTRRIEHLTSPDLTTWTNHGPLPLSSDRVIDACVHPLPDGGWRLWYKDEADGSTTWAADSPDLFAWTVRGKVIGGRPHEGPNVFVLGGYAWMVVDEWHGQRVHRSDDLDTWTPQGLILEEPGSRPGDATHGLHADVVVPGHDGPAGPRLGVVPDDVTEDEAWIVYFTHPGSGDETPVADVLDETTLAQRRAVVQVARLTVVDGVLRCDRDGGAGMRLPV